MVINGNMKKIIMPQSKKRGGKKQHNKRVKARNERIKKEYEAAVKQAWSKFEQYKQENGSQNNQSIPTIVAK